MKKCAIFAVFLEMLFVLFGCSGTHRETTINVSGSWSSQLYVDGQKSADSTSSPYRLSLSDTGRGLLGEFHFPEKDGKPVFMLSGTNGPDGVILIGSNAEESLSLSGQVLDSDTLQMFLETGGGRKEIILFFRDKQPTPGKYINAYKFEKKCGSGSPVILIHGMDDDASTWDEMIERFKDDGVCDKHSVYTYQYDWIVSIYDNGLQLGVKILEQNFSEHPIIVAHSMGGLVTR